MYFFYFPFYDYNLNLRTMFPKLKQYDIILFIRCMLYLYFRSIYVVFYYSNFRDIYLKYYYNQDIILFVNSIISRKDVCAYLLANCQSAIF